MTTFLDVFQSYAGRGAAIAELAWHTHLGRDESKSAVRLADSGICVETCAILAIVRTGEGLECRFIGRRERSTTDSNVRAGPKVVEALLPLIVHSAVLVTVGEDGRDFHSVEVHVAL